MELLSHVRPVLIVVLSAVPGCLAAVLGWRNYRRTGKMKTLDLRLELRKVDAEIKSLVLGLPELLDTAKVSRERVLTASGRAQSGAMQICRDELRKDGERQQRLAQALPADDPDYRGCSPEALEQELVRRRAALGEAKGIASKYERWMADDNLARAQVIANRAKFF
ncbi:MAG: hypothetical protein M0P72_09785 [Metallibacterium scheffleri]|jgi:hypothetical protein|uniref:hypothetical protein n=1 Tax=Metallibacterium scheffleri TaxID=993689 RepID=UPI0026F31585|nr:hypothetical protein [Metallibacterium scheffleri]MCK9367421.1 hypothetical protein [Metallibacterium scheffleri]